MAQFQRLGRIDCTPVSVEFDGEAIVARAGDTVLTAILTRRGHVRHSEFGGGARAGFCLMGACQDCWLWLGPHHRVRACTTLVREGMKLYAVRPA
jgi:hypothetical protein